MEQRDGAKLLQTQNWKVVEAMVWKRAVTT
jgi:hypothetical protein